MASEENTEEGFIFPTNYKAKIGSYLSWPLGAKELTEAFRDVPQAKQFYLEFGTHHSYHQGKWPARFVVIETIYNGSKRLQCSNITDFNERRWHFHIYPVPRNMRSGVKEALKQGGFQQIRKQLARHQHLSSSESYWRFELIWDSNVKELASGSYDYILPKISAGDLDTRK